MFGQRLTARQHSSLGKMDPEKILKFVVSYLSDYLRSLVYVLTQPQKTFKADLVVDESNIITTRRAPLKLKIDPKLLGFSVISILIGSIFLNYGDLKNQEFGLDRTIYTFFMWFFVGTIAFFTSRALLGKRTFFEISSYCIQIFAALFVVCSAAHLFWVMIVRLTSLDNKWPNAFTIDTLNLYFLIQVLLIFSYISFGVSKLNGFGLIRTTFHAVLVASVFLGINIGMSRHTPAPIMSPLQPKIDNIEITLMWDGDLDLDLSLSLPDGLIVDYRNPSNPSYEIKLIEDIRSGPGNERIIVKYPNPGTYTISVKRYSNNGKTEFSLESRSNEDILLRESGTIDNNSKEYIYSFTVRNK